MAILVTDKALPEILAGLPEPFLGMVYHNLG
jgi:hypothetical protein